MHLSEYEVKVQLLVDAITINKQRIAAKIKEPTSIASLEDTDSLLIEIGTLIDGFNKKIKENNEIVRDLKTKKVLCKKQVWEYLAELLKADVAAYNKALSDLDTEIKVLKDKMEQLKKDATAKKKEANELNKQIVNTEATIDSINVLLDNSGFEGFHLRAKDGVANTYEVIRPDGTVAEKLSEGERNFIAFLYYYHLVKGSLNSEAVKDKIVVIDDPVSSMDSGALFIVSALVREMIEVCYNNTDYRSHKVDGDYIKQIFILTHNVYFHKEITHHQAKRYHSVSFYMIRKIENISSVKLCVRQSQRVPTEQENYNPIQNSYAALWDEYKELKTANTVKNVIRHILEYYFIQICGYEGNDLHKIVLEQNKLLFVDEVEGQKPNYDRYNLASSMLTYMNDGPAVISDFDRYFAVDREMLFKFLEDTQHETMEYLRKIYKSDLEETIVSFINAETTKTRGSLLDVLKHGIEISNQKLELMYTKPATTFNPDLTRKYGQNIFSAMEEVWASDKERIDVVIFLNGLAIIAFELKSNSGIAADTLPSSVATTESISDSYVL